MQHDTSRLSEAAQIGAASLAHQPIQWRCNWTLHKFDDPTGQVAEALEGGADLEQFAAALTEVIEREGNLLMYGGASVLWQALLGNGTTTADQALTYFSNARAAIGVGDSTTAAAATQTNLQASSNKLRKAMDATYPTHTDGTTSGAASIVFRSTFGSSEANYAWQEWGVFNSATDATGRMLNRKVESLGTKASGATWVFTVTLSLS